jgi:hypothetical protein
MDVKEVGAGEWARQLTSWKKARYGCVSSYGRVNAGLCSAYSLGVLLLSEEAALNLCERQL